MASYFGFAPPVQHRPFMQMQPMQAPANPAPDGGNLAGDIKTGLQKLGLMKPPMPGAGLPSAGGPSPIDIGDPAGAMGMTPATSVAHSMGSLAPQLDLGGAAADGASSGLADAASGIGDFLAALFGG